MTGKTVRIPDEGDAIDGRYMLGRRIGQGGMGSVHLGTHLKLGREVAVKLLRPEFSLDEHFRSRFQREALIMSKIHHPGAVSIIDYGMHEGCLFLVMECLGGGELRAVLSEHPKGLPTTKVLAYSLQLCEVLIATHGHDIVHRDLKPENVIVEPLPGGKERLVVLDFGLAFVEQSDDLGRQTRAGVTAGTPQYISPEQATGDVITPAADIYSLGCMIYEMCCGRPPFSAFTVLDLLNKHVYNRPKDLRVRSKRDDLPVLLEHTVMSMLRKEPPERPDAGRAAEMFQMMIAETPHGPDARRRGAKAFTSRSERMIGPPGIATMPTAPDLSREGQPKSPPAGGSNHEDRPYQNVYRVALDGEMLSDDEITVLAIGSVECRALDELGGGFDAIYTPQASPARVKQLSDTYGVPIISAVEPGDTDRLSALIEVGAAEVVVNRVAAKDLARKLQRAIRKARKRR